jgi:valyl-tRNA synthetase
MRTTSAGTVHDFAWSDYCDWYLETVKVELRRDESTADARWRSWNAAAEVLSDLLRLLHPIMPFVTEAIWPVLAGAAPQVRRDDDALVTARWPSAGERDLAGEQEFEAVAALVREVRNLRTQAGVAAGSWVPLVVAPTDDAASGVIKANAPYLEVLGRVRPVEISVDGVRPAHVAASPLGAAWLGVDPATVEAVAERRRAQVGEIDRNIDRLRGLLANQAFLDRAPADVVERERERLAALEEERRQLAAGAG